MKATGRYDEVHARRFGVLESHTLSLGQLLRYAAGGAGLFALVLVGAVLWQASLRRQLARRTHELRARQQETPRYKSALLALAQSDLSDRQTAHHGDGR